MTTNATVTAKPRYEVLDGLRGVAAMIVLFYHHFDHYSLGNPVTASVNHGYLAVDFFFILSGYVIGYAYDDRWGRMSLTDFFKRRLVRLHPMIVFSTLFGMMFFYFGISDTFPLIADAPVGKLLLCALLSILMMPAPVSMDVRGWSEVNAINGNAWTLYFEYFANILYALVIRHFSRGVLMAFVFLSALLTLNLTLNLDVFGLFGGRAAQAYTVIGGWTLNGEQVMVGFTRLLFPFFCGLLLSRMGHRIAMRRGFLWCSALLVAILLMPRIGGAEHPLWNGLYESVSILLLFPLLVLMGAGSTVSGATARVCKFLGEISYPLYIVQYPVVYTLLGGWLSRNPDATQSQAFFVHVMCFMLSIAVAYASLRLYDEPVRRWLSTHWLHRPAKG